jgi:hypothetical protein
VLDPAAPFDQLTFSEFRGPSTGRRVPRVDWVAPCRARSRFPAPPASRDRLSQAGRSAPILNLVPPDLPVSRVTARSGLAEILGIEPTRWRTSRRLRSRRSVCASCGTLKKCVTDWTMDVLDLGSPVDALLPATATARGGANARATPPTRRSSVSAWCCRARPVHVGE